MGWVWNSKLIEPTVIPCDICYSVKTSQRCCSASCSCDIVVRLFQEQDIVHYQLSFFLLLLPQEGRTALVWASLNKYINVKEKLLAAGANPIEDEVRNLVTRVMLICVSMHLFLIKSFIYSEHNHTPRFSLDISAAGLSWLEHFRF